MRVQSETRYRTCVPFVKELEAPAGAFSDAHGPLHEAADPSTRCLEVDWRRRLRPGMFAAAVAGRSIEPRIPDGSICLFRGPATSSRSACIVLARLRDAVDPDTGE